MGGRSNELSREICRVKDVDDVSYPVAVGDAAGSMAQAPRCGIAHRRGTNGAMPMASNEAARQKSELSE